MSMPKSRFAGLFTTCGALLAFAAPASADFVPALGIALEPPTAGGPAALTATIAQPPLDTAIERFTLTLPAGFQALDAPDAAICPLRTIRFGDCPAASRIGTVDGVSGAALGVTGEIHKASPDKFAVVLTVLGSIRQVVPGSISAGRDGALDLTLDELPALALSRLTLRFDGAGRSLVRTPAECGTYAIDGKFTSRHEELALARMLVAISGCTGVPAIGVSNLRMSSRRVKRGRTTIIAWSAARAADHTNVRIERRKNGRWRVAAVLVSTANAGENILRWNGRVGGKSLKPGRYRLRVQPAGSAPAEQTLRFRIVKPRARHSWAAGAPRGASRPLPRRGA